MRSCAEPGCPQLVERGYCSAHQREPPPRRWQHDKKTAERGYGGAHQRWRAAVLRRDPLCVDCLSQGRRTPATDADHIDGNPFNRTPENGRGLCRRCHNRRTHGKGSRERQASPATMAQPEVPWSFE